MKTYDHIKRSAGFTLIELLVVISIMMILMGLLFAGVTAVIKAAKKTKAFAAISTIKTASRAYWTTYGVWPNTGSTTISDSTAYFVNCMQGSDTNTNPRGIKFMDFALRDLATISGGQGFFDPYGTPRTYYSIYYDTNGDGLVNSSDAGGPQISVQDGVAIWCWGPNRTNEWGGGDDIVSWR